MNPQATDPIDDDSASTESAVSRKAKAKPGQRRMEILQAFAAMLEQPMAERVTTAALAKRLGVSEAALYRQFASKAQMLDALITFTEDSLLGLAAKVGEPGADGLDGRAACGQIVWLALQFAQANPGMVRVLVGDALVFEQARLTERVALLFEKLEAVLRAHWRHWASQQDLATPTADAQVRAALLLVYLRGVLHAFVRSDWKQLPTQGADAHLETLLG